MSVLYLQAYILDFPHPLINTYEICIDDTVQGAKIL